MTQYIAREYTHNDPMKLLRILDKVCDHRPWFSDNQWENKEARYAAARRYLADAVVNGKLWEVYAISGDTPPEVIGILMLNRLNLGVDAYCHFVFFDHELASKKRLCLEAMRWAFKTYDLQILRIEVPTYAHALVGWARRKLGFRYEAEARPLSWPKDAKPLTTKQAELGSRRHRAVLYENRWHDELLLSLTKEEFEAQHEWSIQDPIGESERQHSSHAGPESGSGEHAATVPPEPPSNSGELHRGIPTADPS